MNACCFAQKCTRPRDGNLEKKNTDAECRLRAELSEDSQRSKTAFTRTLLELCGECDAFCGDPELYYGSNAYSVMVRTMRGQLTALLQKVKPTLREPYP
jgi:hypothetical protein